MPATLTSIRPPTADRLGVALSSLCAVHCLLTPPLLLLLPTFGRFWAHPASHWGMAAFVVPLALLSLPKGFRLHGRRWVLACGILGTSLILLGAALPYLPQQNSSAATETTCDACCPSVETTETGDARLQIPPASIVTTLGGVALIATHLGNLCGCLGCRRTSVPA